MTKEEMQILADIIWETQGKKLREEQEKLQKEMMERIGHDYPGIDSSHGYMSPVSEIGLPISQIKLDEKLEHIVKVLRPMKLEKPITFLDKDNEIKEFIEMYSLNDMMKDEYEIYILVGGQSFFSLARNFTVTNNWVIIVMHDNFDSFKICLMAIDAIGARKIQHARQQ